LRKITISGWALPNLPFRHEQAGGKEKDLPFNRLLGACAPANKPALSLILLNASPKEHSILLFQRENCSILANSSTLSRKNEKKLKNWSILNP
jgi:hypothetical protein